MLKQSQVQFVEDELHRKGITYDPLHEDLVDHICCEIELHMHSGYSFMDAYHIVIQQFEKPGLRKLNDETIHYLNFFTMLSSYLTQSIRYMVKHKLFSTINITGLSLGMAACYFILHYVTYELSFDQFHTRSSSIYRITQQTVHNEDNVFHTATAYLPVARLAQEEFPEIVRYNRFYYLDRHAVVSYGEKKFEQEGVLYADANFFNFFSYDLLYGNADDVLSGINSVALAESVVRKYFGSTNPIGKLIRFTEEFNDLTLIVTGVFKDTPSNSHFHPQLVVSLSSIENLEETKANYWNWPFYMSYIQLLPDTDPVALEAKLSGIVSRYFPANEKESQLLLQSLEDIHLYSQLNYEAEPNGNAKLVFLLLAVAILILLIAYANYINLTTARSLDRAKEVAIRKTLGSKKVWLINQFLLEAMFINGLALVLAVIFVQVTKESFQHYTGISREVFEFQGVWFFGVMLLLFVAGSFVSSLYPAFFLSSFQPITTLKGKVTSSLSGHAFRRLLVLFQFAASICLMIAAFAIYLQLQFMMSQPLGITMDNVLIIKGPRVDNSPVRQGTDPFIQKASGHTDIQSMSLSGSVPGIWTSQVQGVSRLGSDLGLDNFYSVFEIDHEFLTAYNLNILAGQNFKAGTPPTNPTVIINLRALERLGFASPEDAIGSSIRIRNTMAEIRGVIQDYHHFSLKEEIEPLILYPIQDGSKEYYSLKIKSQEVAGRVISALEADWKSVYPDNPFEYFFLTNSFNAQYAQDEQFKKVFILFSVLAVSVACLGLYGLVSFVTTKRTKEIGIRKVLGSSAFEVMLLLATDFLKLILAAALIALPLSYLGIQNWLRNFAYSFELSVWIFIFPVLLILAIALLSISTQTVRAARINPAEILKDE